jgi:hypothetical protein
MLGAFTLDVSELFLLPLHSPVGAEIVSFIERVFLFDISGRSV